MPKKQIPQLPAATGNPIDPACKLPVARPDGELEAARVDQLYPSIWPVDNGGTGKNLAALSGKAGRNLRVTVAETGYELDPTPDYLTQATWCINADTGNDANDGLTAGTAIKTARELFRRLGPSARIRPPLNAAAFCRLWTLNILSDLPQTDPLQLDLWLTQGVCVHIKGGVKSVDYTGTIDAFTNKVLTLGSNTRARITSNGLPAAGSWTDHLAKRVRITSGARANACWWVSRDLGNRQCEISEPLRSVAMVGANPYDFTDVTLSVMTPTVNDPIQVETLRSITLGAFRIVAEGASDFTVDAYPTVVIGELAVNVRGEYVPIGLPPNSNMQLNTYSCRFVRMNSSAEGWFSINDCFGHDAFGGARLQVNNGYMRKSGGLVTAGPNADCSVRVQPGALVTFDYDSQIHKGQLQVQGAAQVGSLSVWDTPNNFSCPGGHAVLLGQAVVVGGDPNSPGATMAVGAFGIDSSRRLWGSGATGTGVMVGYGCSLAAQAGTAVLMVRGASDFRLGLATRTTARAWNESTGAWTAQLSCTWTLWGTAIGSSGFGGNVAGTGNAQDVASGARIFAQ